MKTVAQITRTALFVMLIATSLMASGVMAQSRVKSESTAKSLSLWLTVIPTTTSMVLGSHDKHTAAGALLITGMIIGPSTGYFYGNCSFRGAQGILIRAITGGVTAALAVSVADLEFPEGLAAIAIGGAGIGAIIYEDVYDISHVKSEVRKQNKEITKLSFKLVPRFFAQGRALGLELRATL